MRRLERLMLIAGGCIALFALGLGLLSISSFKVCLWLARIATGSGNSLQEATFKVLAPRLTVGATFFGALGLTLACFRHRLASLAVPELTQAGAAFRWHWQSAVAVLQTETRPHLIALGSIMLLGGSLRAWYLHELPRYDETLSYLEFARRSLVHALAYYPAPNNHILSTAGMWLSCRIFGSEPWAWRLPVLFAGIALMPMIYAAGRRFAGRNAGLYAAGIAAVAPPMVLYSVDARGYMWQALFLAAMLLLAAAIAERTEGASWTLLGAVATAAFWTVPTTLYAYLIVVAWILWRGRTRRLLSQAFASTLVTGIAVSTLYMPAAIISGPENLFRNPWVRPLEPDRFWAAVHRFPALLADFVHGGDFMAVPFLLCAGIALSLLLRTRLHHFWPHPLAIVILVLLAVSAMQRVVPFPRTLLPLMCIYYLSAAAGWAALENRFTPRYDGFRAAVLLVLLGGSAVYLVRSGYIESRGGFRAAKPVAGFLVRALSPGDRLVISLSAGPAVEFELRRAGIDVWRYTSPASLDSARRLFVVMGRLKGPLPQAGNGLADPEALTFDGTMKEARVDEALYSEPRLVYTDGTGEVFELLARGANAPPQS